MKTRNATGEPGAREKREKRPKVRHYHAYHAYHGGRQGEAMSYLGLLKKSTGESNAVPPADNNADPTEGRIIAVKICSRVLDSCIWLSFDPDFKPDDDEQLAVFYADEIPFIADKTTEELKAIHQSKLTYGPGTRVGQ